MATENKHVACYLPPDIEQKVTDYAHKHGITRKDSKPRFGSAIVEILREYFAQYNTNSNNDSGNYKKYVTKYNTKVTFGELIIYFEGLSCSIDIEYNTRSATKSDTSSNRLSTKDIVNLIGYSASSVKRAAKKAVDNGSYQFSWESMTFEITHKPKNSSESWEFKQVQ